MAEPALQLLVVDDDELTLDLAVETLGRHGVVLVVAATGGDEALRLIDEEHLRPDLVLCELHLPGMDGLLFLRELAARNWSGSIAVISDAPPDVLRGAASLAETHGLDHVGSLTKPLTADALRELLARVVARGPQPEPSGQVDPAVSRHALEAALQRGHLQVHYQPQVRVADGTLVGFEALARWQDATLGVVPPDAFIPLAEETGLIHEVTHTVMGTVLADLRAGGALGDVADVPVAVNLSTKVLGTAELPERWEAMVADAGVSPGRLVFEVTEGRLAEDQAMALEILSRLRLRGFGLSVDDFGTGYASMDQLRAIPFSEMKIDRSFVHGSAWDAATRAILEAAAELGRALGLRVVAEGVEVREDWEVVAAAGIDVVQGWFVARSMPAAAAAVWAASWRGVPPNGSDLGFAP